MNLYETTFIINPQTDDATIDRHVREIAELITSNDGQIRFEDHMGTRRLAYEIQGLTQGYYASFIFEAPISFMPKLDRHFKLNESYVRYLTVRYEGDLEKLMQRREVAPADSAAVASAPAPQEVAKPQESAEPVEEKTEEIPIEASDDEPTQAASSETADEPNDEPGEDKEL